MSDYRLMALEERTAELLALQDAYTGLARERHVYRELALMALGHNAALRAECDFALAQVRGLQRKAKAK